VTANLPEHLLHAHPVLSLGRQDRNLPVDVLGGPGAPPVQVRHEADLGDQRGGAVPVSLVDDEDVGDLHEPRLHGLDGVAGFGNQHHHRGVGLLDDVQLGLPDPDALDQNPLLAERIQEPDHIAGGAGQPAQAPPGGHAPDEHVRVQGVGLHPDPVAEHCPSGKGTGRVHSDNADGAARGAKERGEAVDQGALSRPRGAR